MRLLSGRVLLLSEVTVLEEKARIAADCTFIEQCQWHCHIALHISVVKYNYRL
jgi:hypothetical protein